MKKYVICTSLEEQSLATLKKLKKVIDLQQAEVHVVTIFEIKLYNVDLAPYVYPSESQYPAIEKSAESILTTLAASLEIKKEKLITKCLFSSSMENAIKEYLVDVDADLVISATRGKHGLEGFFSSSFTDYLCKFSPCDILVLRPE